MTDPRPICPSCGRHPYRLEAPCCTWSCRCGHSWSEGAVDRLAELEAQLAHAQGDAASFLAAYEAALARLSGVQAEADEMRLDRDRALERIRELELAVPTAREVG